MVDQVLAQLSRRFDSMYDTVGRPSIPPEQLLRAQLLQMLYTVRSERRDLPPTRLGTGCPRQRFPQFLASRPAGRKRDYFRRTRKFQR